MVKISNLPPETAATVTDKMAVVDVETSTTKNLTLQQLITLAFNNIPAGTIPATGFDYVISGGVWTGDSYGVNRNASMTALSIYINNRTIAINAVVARTFTASKDTYIDVLDNNDGTGTLVYTEVANNAASPALASNSVRIGIIVTGATTIAAVGSVNQGQEDKVLPIASSIAYSVTDSLGNLICPRDPNRKILGYRQITTNFTTTSTTGAQITGLTCPVIVPTGRKIKITAYSAATAHSVNTTVLSLTVWDGVVGSGTQLNQQNIGLPSNSLNSGGAAIAQTTPSSASKTYNAGAHGSQAGTSTCYAGVTSPSYILVELE